MSEPTTETGKRLTATLTGARRLLPGETWDAADGMCPNCVTPWKCNGPHEPPEQTKGEPVWIVSRADILAIEQEAARAERERLRTEAARIRLGIIRNQVSWNSDGAWLNWLDNLLAEPDE